MSKNKPSESQPNNLVHHVKLKDMLVELEQKLGWEEMGRRININCFTNNPSLKSSLNFLRKTPWAKEKVQQLYIAHVKGELKPLPKIKKWPFLK